MIAPNEMVWQVESGGVRGGSFGRVPVGGRVRAIGVRDSTGGAVRGRGAIDTILDRRCHHWRCCSTELLAERGGVEGECASLYHCCSNFRGSLLPRGGISSDWPSDPGVSETGVKRASAAGRMAQTAPESSYTSRTPHSSPMTESVTGGIWRRGDRSWKSVLN